MDMTITGAAGGVWISQKLCDAITGIASLSDFLGNEKDESISIAN